MLMRWVFLICLLANGILLLRYAILQDEPVVAVPASEQASEILLLSEAATPSLEPRKNVVPTGQCAFISGIDWLADAERIAEYLQQTGFSSERQQFSEQAVAGYSVSLAAPVDAVSRLEMLDQLDRLGVVPETRRSGEGLSFLLGSFSSRADAEALRAKLSELGDGVELGTDMQQIARYQLRVLLPSGHDLSSEIKAVLKKAYKLIKIEKKPCLGVASTKVAG